MAQDGTEELTVTFGRLSLTVRAWGGAAPARPTSSASEQPPVEDPESWITREKRATAAGVAARRILDGFPPRTNPFQRTRKSNVLWVVVRNLDGFLYTPPLVCDRWSEAKPLVQDGAVLGSSAVFHGFASRRELDHYLDGLQ